MCGDWWDTYYNLLNGYALHGYVLVGYVWVGYVWNGYVWDMCDVLDMCGICVVDTFGMDMCGICVMCWICVGYVWCEIRKQSSEEPCDETSFGKKLTDHILCCRRPWILPTRPNGGRLTQDAARCDSHVSMLDWLTFDPRMFAPLFPRLKEGILRDVFIQKAVVAWDNALTNRIMVSLLLPGAGSNSTGSAARPGLQDKP